MHVEDRVHTAPPADDAATRSTAERASGDSTAALDVEFFDAPLTAELWETYERAARSYGCTREFIEYFERPAAPMLALVRRRADGEISAAFVYTHEGETAQVHGRFSAPPADAVAAFASALLARHPRVRRVDTNLIDALPDPRAVGRPALPLREGTELRVTLPATVREYEDSLSKDLLDRVRYYRRRLARELPSARFTTREGEAIPRAWIAEVIRLNHQRMASKNVRSVFSPEYEEGIARVARRHGCVTVLHDDARIYSGVIDIRCGADVFGWVIGHDDEYAKLRPGRLVQLEAIGHCIERGYRTFHFLHGESGYKQELGGRVAPLASYVLLRSWAALRPGDVARLARLRLGVLSRRAVDRADALAGRLLGTRRDTLKSLARSVSGAVRGLRRA